MKKKNIYLVIFISSLIVGSIIGYHYYYFKNKQAFIEQKYEYQIPSEELYRQYQKNRLIADLKYQSKVIQITGTVMEVYSRNKNQIRLILRNENTYNGVSCILDNSSKQIREPLKIGSKITIRGLCSGMDTNVLMMKCILIKS